MSMVSFISANRMPFMKCFIFFSRTLLRYDIKCWAVTLVVHPRKEDEGARLGISSFYGSAKATQEADTVLILQSDGKRKFVDVKKNRFDGTLGHVPLYFQRRSGRYSETPDVITSQTTVIPNGITAINGAKKMNGTTRALSSIYEDIRGQHPI